MKKIVFVCVENSCRSQMAEAFGKMHGNGIVEVYSSGSRPSGVVNPKAIASMKEVMDDIKARVLAYFGMGPEAAEDTPWMDEYMAKVMKDEKTMDETYRRLLFDKLFTFLETKFKLVDKEIDEDSFFKLQSAHDEHHHH